MASVWQICRGIGVWPRKITRGRRQKQARVGSSCRNENESGVNERRCFPGRDLDSGQPVGDGVPIYEDVAWPRSKRARRRTETATGRPGQVAPGADVVLLRSLGS